MSHRTKMLTATVLNLVPTCIGINSATGCLPAVRLVAHGRHSVTFFSICWRIFGHQKRCRVRLKIFSTAKYPPLTRETGVCRGCLSGVMMALPIGKRRSLPLCTSIACTGHFSVSLAVATDSINRLFRLSATLHLLCSMMALPKRKDRLLRFAVSTFLRARHYVDFLTSHGACTQLIISPSPFPAELLPSSSLSSDCIVCSCKMGDSVCALDCSVCSVGPSAP